MNNLFNNLPQQGQNQEEKTAGSLERLGIPVETQIDDNVLGPGASKSVKFRVSRPEGYSFQEVEEFVLNILTPSIDWYAQTLYQRDKAVHLLGKELDQAYVDLQNLKAQLQFAEMNSNIKQGIDRNSDDREAVALMESLRQSQADVESLQAQLAAVTAGAGVAAVASGGDNSEEVALLNGQIAELNEYIETVTAQYNQLYAQYEELAANGSQTVASDQVAPGGDNSEEVALLNGQIAELNEYIETVTAQYNQLYAQYEELATSVSDGAVGAVVASPEASAPDLSNYVPVADYQALEEKTVSLMEENAKLRSQLEEALAANGDTVEEEVPVEGEKRRPLLASEEKKRAVEVDLSKFGELPPGIRPEDLV